MPTVPAMLSDAVVDFLLLPQSGLFLLRLAKAPSSAAGKNREPSVAASPTVRGRHIRPQTEGGQGRNSTVQVPGLSPFVVGTLRPAK